MNAADRSRRAFRAATWRRIRRERPDVASAVRFLPREAREGIFAAAGFLLLLSDVLQPESPKRPASSAPRTGTGNDAGTGAGDSGSGSGSRGRDARRRAGEGGHRTPHHENEGGGDRSRLGRKSTNSKEAKGGEADSESRVGTESELNAGSGCGCGAAGDRELRTQRLVAGRIIDFVYHEGQPGEVGRAEIEVFLDARARFGWPERISREFADALADLRTRQRIATLRSLYSLADRLARAAGEIVRHALPAEAEAMNAPSGDDLACALGRAVVFTSVLESLPAAAGAGRLLIPLDLLARQGLRDADLIDHASRDGDDASEAGTTSVNSKREVDDAARAVLERSVGEARQAFARAGRLLEDESSFSDALRRSILLFALHHRDRLDQAAGRLTGPRAEADAPGWAARAARPLRRRWAAFREALALRPDRLVRIESHPSDRPASESP